MDCATRSTPSEIASSRRWARWRRWASRAGDRARGGDLGKPVLAEVQSDIVAAKTRLASTEERRNRQRARLRVRLKESRAHLAAVLRDRCTDGWPDIVAVVLRADAFAHLLASVAFLKRVELQNQRILNTEGRAPRRARPAPPADASRRGAACRPVAVRRRRDALATVAAGNLARPFSVAQGASAVLLFDEAGAVFGRRPEFQDSGDRYANLQTAYPLQRIERHDGARDPGVAFQRGVVRLPRDKSSNGS